MIRVSALKHGFFRRGFMLCDRCVLNARCESFEAGGECAVEKEAYDWLISRLMEGYDLEGVADEILAGRVAMYLIRIARAEAYESAMGVTDKSVLWGKYISRLDNTLRGIMGDLAVTRAKRKQLEKGERLMVDLDYMLKKFAQKSERRARKFVRVQKRRVRRFPVKILLVDWSRERRRFGLPTGGGEGADEEREKVPRKAVEPLMETCEGLSRDWGKPAATIFREFLELMDKYADYFFDERWPKEPERHFGLKDEELEFIDGGRSLEEQGERFTLVCLRRNMSLEGFDQEGFTGDFEFYGRSECSNCSIREAVHLREEVERHEQSRKEIEEEMKHEKPSWIVTQMHEHLKKPYVVREDKMRLVKLRLLEEVGGAKDRTCKVRNRYRCPYGETSEQLIKNGRVVRSLWKQIEWYHSHWYRSPDSTPSAQDMKWYHYDEPCILDVTSYEDILKAAEDGRLRRIIEEHERYAKETGLTP